MILWNKPCFCNHLKLTPWILSHGILLYKYIGTRRVTIWYRTSCNGKKYENKPSFTVDRRYICAVGQYVAYYVYNSFKASHLVTPNPWANRKIHPPLYIFIKPILSSATVWPTGKKKIRKDESHEIYFIFYFSPFFCIFYIFSTFLTYNRKPAKQHTYSVVVAVYAINVIVLLSLRKKEEKKSNWNKIYKSSHG